jgi:hypothetical protein
MDYWEEYASQVLANLSDRNNFDTVLQVGFAKRGDSAKTHLLSSSMQFDSFGLPMAATGLFTALQPLPTGPGSNQATTSTNAATTTASGPDSGGPGASVPRLSVSAGSGEPTIDVQVGGTSSNPIYRPVALSSLAKMWIM